MYLIKMKLPSLNEYIRWCRGNKYAAASAKKKIEDHICFFIKDMPMYENPIKITFRWIEENKRRDLDNVAFAKKFILDAMVKAGKLKDDNRKFVRGFADEFEYGKEPSVILIIKEVKDVSV